MNEHATPIAYAAYCRKSSEQEDRQVASIGSQKQELSELATRDGLAAARRFEESHSAKRPGRPIFNELVAEIERGKINGLLTWNPNRLSRNAVDTGILIDLMDRDKLQEIRTPSQTYRNTPSDKFLLGLFCGQAKLENDNKGIDVKRGLRTKAEQGIYPAPAPIGYINDRNAERGNKTILPDPKRFHQVRGMFDLMLTGDYTPPQILAIANEEWGFTTPLGHKMSRSSIYLVFSRPFYYGRFEYPVGSGNWYDGIHKPMITPAEYRRIQSLIQCPEKSKATWGRLEFAYRGPLRCGGCRAKVTAERRTKRQRNGNVHNYVYYHCTRRKDPTCREPAIREDRLEEQIEALLASIELPREFRTWGLAYLEKRQSEAHANRDDAKREAERAIVACDKKLDALLDLRIGGELTEGEYAAKKAKLIEEKDALTNQAAKLDEADESYLTHFAELLDFAETARKRFAKGDPDKRKQIVRSLGSNLLLSARRLSTTRNHWLVPMKVISRILGDIHARFEPRKTRMNLEQWGHIYSQCPLLLRALDDVRNKVGGDS